jgi:hypothetical protein
LLPQVKQLPVPKERAVGLSGAVVIMCRCH